MKLPPIKDIEVEGFSTSTRIMPHSWRALTRIYSDVGLPAYKQLHRIGNVDKLWILPWPITITVTYANGMIH